jgi:predicted transport protein
MSYTNIGEAPGNFQPKVNHYGKSNITDVRPRPPNRKLGLGVQYLDKYQYLPGVFQPKVNHYGKSNITDVRPRPPNRKLGLGVQYLDKYQYLPGAR